MAIDVRSSTPALDTVQTSTTTATIAIPNDVLNDDVLIFVVVNADSSAAPSSVADNSGIGSWALHGSGVNSGFTSVLVYWKRVTNQTTERLKTVTASGLTDSTCCGITTYTGVITSGSPFDQTAVGESNAAADNTHNAGITTQTANAMVGLAAGWTDNSPVYTAGSTTATDPATFTDRLRVTSTGGLDSMIMHASAIRSAAGATGAISWAGTSDAGSSVAFVLKPAPGAIITGAAALAGSGALAATGARLLTGAGTLAGSGALAASGLVPVQGAAAITGSGALAASGTRIVSGAAAIAGSGALAADGVIGGWGAPQNLVATAVSQTQINLRWDAVIGATGYDVERDAVVIAQDVAQGTVGSPYQDTGRTASTLYTYRVRAVA